VKTRNTLAQQTVLDGADDLSIRFYLADAVATPPNHPRVEVHLPGPGGGVTVDRPLSEYTDLSGAQKTALRNLLTAIRDQTLALEGFT
jgi:hypothetical protein